MAGDTLGHVAMYAYQKRKSDDVPSWQAVADAVIAAHEAEVMALDRAGLKIVKKEASHG